MADYLHYEMDDSEADGRTEGSIVNELVSNVQAAC
jgi:hypothetical protein